MRLTLGELASLASGRVAAGDPGLVLTGIAVDSRRVRPGDIFCALPGERTDGHRFILDALRGGASAALAASGPELALPDGKALLLVDDPIQALGRAATTWMAGLRPRLRVIGITGSVGKTTTRTLTAAAVATRMGVLEPEGNYNTEIGLPITCLEAGPQHAAAVLELAMRGPGQIARLAEICRPEIGALTLIGPSHLEALGSMEAIAAAKEELVAALPAHGVAILNTDDPWQRAMAPRARAPVQWYGFGPEVDIRATDVELLQGEGSRFRLHLPGQRPVSVRLRLAGRHLVANALAAAGAASALGVPADAVAEGLGRAEPPHDRLEIRRIGSYTLVGDAYNASPASSAAALEVLGELAAPGRALILFGDMLELGPLAESGHREVGRLIARSPARAMATVGSAAEAWVRPEAGLPGRACASPEEAADWALRELAPGDTVLVKGSRGMQMERALQWLQAELAAAEARARVNE
ncbi:MAG TPA: UDP-N-acetylmuramoyl-tripeptide--D-alanyl-D-alanine ligase [Bacillota bacterium]|nr:UDP-N-acetylmuramoyl-tripeptide--D-alanyl-D-alanine ligase [Bacillota bacterium]